MTSELFFTPSLHPAIISKNSIQIQENIDYVIFFSNDVKYYFPSTQISVPHL